MSNPGMLPTGASKTEPPVPAVTAEAPAADSKPMTAEAVAGVERSPRPKQDKAPQSGLLTAGSFDDNLNPNLFRSFVSQMSQKWQGSEPFARLIGRRLEVRVRGADGKPVGHAKVRLSAGNSAAELTTRSDGRAVFLSSWDQIPPGSEW